MGIKATCDCCNKEIDTIHEIGFVDKVYFGDCCIDKYQEYKQSLNDLHTKMANQFKAELQNVRTDWVSKHNGKLPD